MNKTYISPLYHSHLTDKNCQQQEGQKSFSVITEHTSIAQSKSINSHCFGGDLSGYVIIIVTFENYH